MSSFDETQELQYSMDFSDEEFSQKETTNFDETQELQYSIDLSSSSEISSSDDSENDSDMDIPELSTLKPYDHEPTRPLSHSPSPSLSPPSSPESIENKEQEEVGRIGNTNWCQCGKCRPMETFEESLCCRDTNEIPDEKFQGYNFYVILRLYIRILDRHTYNINPFYY